MAGLTILRFRLFIEFRMNSYIARLIGSSVFIPRQICHLIRLSLLRSQLFDWLRKVPVWLVLRTREKETACQSLVIRMMKLFICSLRV